MSLEEQWRRRQEAVEGALLDREVQRQESQKVTRRNRLTPCCKKGEFEAGIYTCCILLGLGFTALLTPFLIIFLSSNEELVDKYQLGSCSISGLNDTGLEVGCKCATGRYCVSNFPCAIVYVNLTYGGKDNGPRNTIKAQIFTTLGNIRMGEKCSYSPCSQDSMQNADNVRAFLRNRHVGDSLRCFYDNTNPYNIIEEKPEVYLLRWDFFPFVVIVGVVALMCWFIVFLVCCLYGCVDCCIFIKENNRLCPQKRPRGDSYN